MNDDAEWGVVRWVGTLLISSLPRGDETARGKVGGEAEQGGPQEQGQTTTGGGQGRATNGKTVLKEYYNNHLDQKDHHHHQQTGQASIRSALLPTPN